MCKTCNEKLIPVFDIHDDGSVDGLIVRSSVRTSRGRYRTHSSMYTQERALLHVVTQVGAIRLD